MAKFTVIYRAIHEQTAEDAADAAKFRLTRETNGALTVLNMPRTRTRPNGDAFTVGIEVEPKEQAIEHSLNFWKSEADITGTIKEGTLADHERFE